MPRRKEPAADTRIVGAIDALDEIEPSLRHLAGLVAALRLLGEVDDSIEPIIVSALARCAEESLTEVERSWRIAIGKLRQG